MFYLRYKFFRWFVGFLTVKSPFLEAFFSRNLICFQVFYLKNTFLHHFCYTHVANPGQEWQKLTSVGGLAGLGTPVVLVANMRRLTGAAPSPWLSGGRLSCSLDPGSSWLYPEPWSSLSSCFSSSTWFTLCEALTLGPQESIFIR